MKRSPSIPPVRGFTLVELLVVVAVVAGLALAAWSGVRAARTKAHQAVSAANLRQLAAANLLYAADHQTYCPAAEPRNLIRWHGGRDSAKTTFDPQRGFLAEYLGFSRQVGRCPEFDRLVSGSSFNEEGTGGYGYNGTYIGGTPPDPFRPNRPAAVPNPSRTLMFATTAFAVADGIQEYPTADPPMWVDANWRPRGRLQPSVHFRFSGRALVAWCDGGVSEELPGERSATNFYGGDNRTARIGFCGPEEDNGWWNPRHTRN
jgi:prepilin-type N-terminal cleavage/methylation domain-containing protein